MSSWHIGVIGGSGLAEGIGLEQAQDIAVASPFGEPSGPVTLGQLGGVRFSFLARHGAGHRLPPNDVNYRANIDVLRRCTSDEIGMQPFDLFGGTLAAECTPQLLALAGGPLFEDASARMGPTPFR